MEKIKSVKISTPTAAVQVLSKSAKFPAPTRPKIPGVLVAGGFQAKFFGCWKCAVGSKQTKKSPDSKRSPFWGVYNCKYMYHIYMFNFQGVISFVGFMAKKEPHILISCFLQKKMVILKISHKPKRSGEKLGGSCQLVSRSPPLNGHLQL